MKQSSDHQMDNLLKELMESLEAIGNEHQEMYDTAVREAMTESILDGFVKPKPNFVLGEEFGVYEDEGNQKIKAALNTYISAATLRAAEIGLNSPTERLAAFQNDEIHTDEEANYPDDFFGWVESFE